MENPNPKETINASKEENGILKYFIAGCILGTAIGNMFVARKMKSFEHMSSPFAPNSRSYWRSSTSNSSQTNSSQSYYEEAAKRRTAEANRQRERVQDFNHQREQTERLRQQFEQWEHKYHGPQFRIPSKIKNSLKILKITPNQLNKADIKLAYQTMAMKYHPDTIPVHDKRKNEYDKKFQEINSAYRELMAHVNSNP